MAQQSRGGGEPKASIIFYELAVGTIRAAALTIEVFLHRNFGSFYPTVGLFGFVLIAMFSQLCPPQTIGPLFWFAIAYGVGWLIAEANVMIRWWRGDHSVPARYNGRPHLCQLLPHWKEVNVKLLEALLAMAVGFAFCLLWPALGIYIVIASTLMFLRAWNYAAQLRNRAIEMNDSILEEQIIAERFRELQESQIS